MEDKNYEEMNKHELRNEIRTKLGTGGSDTVKFNHKELVKINKMVDNATGIIIWGLWE